VDQKQSISQYMEILLNSEFLQFKVLSSDEFLTFLNRIGIEFSLSELEYYDKKDIIKPALKLHKPKIKDQHQKYATILNDAFSMKNYYYKHGLIEFPRENKEGVQRWI
jgi:hypothetical protein